MYVGINRRFHGNHGMRMRMETGAARRLQP